MLANSMWMRCMEWLAHGQVCRGATGGKLLWAAQLLQLVTTSSISLSMLGYHTILRAKAFIFTIPGCDICNSFNI